jgi:hypothetical protein
MAKRGSSLRGEGSALAGVREMHAAGNRRSKDDWERFAGHRERLTAAIEQLAGAAGQGGDAGALVLLGAGNCNDVDVEALAARFSSIHLVDIDGGALDRGRGRLSPQVRGKTVAHGGIDLTGLLAAIDGGGQALQGAALEQAMGRGVQQILAGLPVGQAGVVVSCCLLSQLGWSLEQAAGGDEEYGMQLRTAALTVHLRTLAALARPAGPGRAPGIALVAADIVSSDLYPLDELPANTDLRALAAELIGRQEIVYASANPVLLARLVRRDPALKSVWDGVAIGLPWLWSGQFDKTYLVYPQVLRRR